MLRKANDEYRKTIFDAQVYANTGAGTLNQAVDMATRYFLQKGINCVEYADGKKVNIASYAEMAIRTANTRAVNIAEGEVRKDRKWHLVRISEYGQCSKVCLPWQGRIYVDDVYSGGTAEESKEKGYPLLSEAIDGGLFHPNCKHRSTTYFPELDEDGPIKATENHPLQKEYNKNHRELQKQRRFEKGSLDEKNIDDAKKKRVVAEKKEEKIASKMSVEEISTNELNHDKLRLERFNTFHDPLREVTGAAEDSNPKELQLIIEDLLSSGVEIRRKESGMAYAPGLKVGKPGQFIIEEGASYGAWCHEYKHFCDDRDDGYLGFSVLMDKEKCKQREIDAYDTEIQIADNLGRLDIVERLQKLRDEEVAWYDGTTENS